MTLIKKLTEEEFAELQPLLASGGGNSVAHEILRIIADGADGDKFYLKAKNYPAKSVTYIGSVSRVKRFGYNFRVSIRTMKDKSGWVLLRLPLTK